MSSVRWCSLYLRGITEGTDRKTILVGESEEKELDVERKARNKKLNKNKTNNERKFMYRRINIRPYSLLMIRY